MRHCRLPAVLCLLVCVGWCAGAQSEPRPASSPQETGSTEPLFDFSIEGAIKKVQEAGECFTKKDAWVLWQAWGAGATDTLLGYLRDLQWKEYESHIAMLLANSPYVETQERIAALMREQVATAKEDSVPKELVSLWPALVHERRNEAYPLIIELSKTGKGRTLECLVEVLLKYCHSPESLQAAKDAMPRTPKERQAEFNEFLETASGYLRANEPMNAFPGANAK